MSDDQVTCPVCGALKIGGTCSNSGCLSSPSWNLRDSGKAPTAPSRVNQCFTLDTPTLTPEGWKSLGNLDIGEYVTTWNPENFSLSFERIISKIQASNVPVLEIQTENHQVPICVSWTHRLMTSNGGKWAGSLKPGSILIEADMDGLRENRIISILEGSSCDVVNLRVENHYTFAVQGALADCFSWLPGLRRVLHRFHHSRLRGYLTPESARPRPG